MKKLLILLLTTAFLFQSCGNGTEKKTMETQQTTAEAIPKEFTSPLRPNEKLELGKIYTDIVKYVDFDDNGDNYLFVVEKGKDTIGLIYNKENSKFFKGEEIEIQWKMDSIRYAGDSEFLDYREFWVSAKRLKPLNLTDKSFVISCGGGCAITYNVKEIKPRNQTIKVTFDVEMYVDGQLSENFEETYNFSYGNINTIHKITEDGRNENISEFMPENAQQSFKEFGTELFTLIE